MTRKGRLSLEPPAFIGIAILRCGADGERRHLVEEEVETVVVVDDDRDIGAHALEPRVYGRIAIEERLPVGLVLLLSRERDADARDMGSRNRADDGSHGITRVRRAAAP